MKFDDKVLKNDEKAMYGLRKLYGSYGYTQYKMNKFEEYDTYAQNKEYLVSNRVITFTDERGKLLALKPDVTVSIIKNSKDTDGEPRKLYYNENVYRTLPGTNELTEIMQTGLECMGNLSNADIAQVIELAAQSLSIISDKFVLGISHMGFISGLVDGISDDENIRKKIITCISDKNTDKIEELCNNIGADATPLKKLEGICGTLDEVLGVLKELSINANTEKALTQLNDINKILVKSTVYKNIKVDFSIVNHMNYYNDIVFRGYVDGVSGGILSGGQYDRLMRKMGRKSRAIGFAVYLNMLENAYNETRKDECVDMINIALPKGRLGEKVYGMFENAGYECPEINDNNRKLIFENKEKHIRFFWVKPSDVAIYVERGAADIGVAGKDILAEFTPDVYEMLDLNIGKCKMAVAAKKDFEDDTEKTLKVATKFRNIATEYYREQSRAIDIIKLNGSIELAPILGLSDVIVDIVETGKTLKENNLAVFEDIMKISARVIANKAAYRFKGNSIDRIISALKEQCPKE